MDVLRLLQDHNVPHQVEGTKWNRPGWVNMECPFCTGNPGLHLGITLDGTHGYCWRCGWKPVFKVLAKLLKIREGEARALARSYGGVSHTGHVEAAVRVKAHKLPTDTGMMTKRQRIYLLQRKFDPEKLETEWGLLGTGPAAYLSTGDGERKHLIDFRFRILAPIIWDGQQVSFQARDYTNKNDLRYITCPKDRELIFHKHILYGKQEQWGTTGICVEGITDVWRFGPKAFATFGIEYTREQMILIAKTFKRVWVAYDDDPQAIVQAGKLVGELLFRGIKAARVPIVGDPGGMDQREADLLVKDLLKGKPFKGD